MEDELFWQQIKNSGLKIRPDYTDPTQWVGVLGGKHIGPYNTREEVVATALRWLITQNQEANQQIEAYQAEKRSGGILNVLSGIVQIIFR